MKQTARAYRAKGVADHTFVQVESGPDVMQSTAIDRAKFIGKHGLQGLVGK